MHLGGSHALHCCSLREREREREGGGTIPCPTKPAAICSLPSDCFSGSRRRSSSSREPRATSASSATCLKPPCPKALAAPLQDPVGEVGDFWHACMMKCAVAATRWRASRSPRRLGRTRRRAPALLGRKRPPRRRKSRLICRSAAKVCEADFQVRTLNPAVIHLPIVAPLL